MTWGNLGGSQTMTKQRPLSLLFVAVDGVRNASILDFSEPCTPAGPIPLPPQRFVYSQAYFSR